MISLDLGDATSLREVKRRLREITDRAARDVRGYPDLVHLFVVFLVPAAVRADHLSPAPPQVSPPDCMPHSSGGEGSTWTSRSSMPPDAETASGSPTGSSDRIRERAGMHTDIPLDWQEIRDRSISDIALDEYT